MSNIPRWNDVRADFGDTGRMFSAAQQGLSNAGTVFGQLRASVLAEEQKNIDNAFREKQLGENVRQFDLTNTLEQGKFGETKRRNLVLEEDADLDREQKAKQAMLQHNAAMAGVASQNRGIDLKQKIYNDQQKLFDIQTRVHQDFLTDGNVLKAELDNPNTPDARKAELSRVMSLRSDPKAITPNFLDTSMGNEIAIRGGGIVPATSMSNEAATAQARANAAITRSTEAAKSISDSYIKGASLITKTVTDADYRQIFGRAYDMGIDLTRGTNVKSEEIANILIQSGLKENIIGSGQSPTGDLERFLSNPTNKENSIYQQIMQRANKAVESNSNITKIPDSTPKEQPVNLNNLTNEALAYQREKILASQPNEPTSQQIQARFNQLVRSSWGDMPTDKIPPNALKTLEERALQDARTAIQKERTQATSRIDDEIHARQRNEAMYNSMMYMQ